MKNVKQKWLLALVITLLILGCDKKESLAPRNYDLIKKLDLLDMEWQKRTYAAPKRPSRSNSMVIGNGNVVAFQPSDGKYLVAAPTLPQALVWRYRRDGVLDTTFNLVGSTAITVAGNLTQLPTTRRLFEDSLNRIVVAGSAPVNSSGEANYDFYVARFTPDGRIDTSFNTTGKFLTSFLDGWDILRSVALQTDGKILAGGASAPRNGYFVASLLRLTSNGSLDTSFYSTGKINQSLSGKDLFFENVDFDYYGKIVANRYRAETNVPSSLAIYRFTSTGELDTSFNSAGFVEKTSAAPVYLDARPADTTVLAIANIPELGGAAIRYNSNGTQNSLAQFSGTMLIDKAVSGEDGGKQYYVIEHSGGAIVRFNQDFSISSGLDQGYPYFSELAAGTNGKLLGRRLSGGLTFGEIAYWPKSGVQWGGIVSGGALALGSVCLNDYAVSGSGHSITVSGIGYEGASFVPYIGTITGSLRFECPTIATTGSGSCILGLITGTPPGNYTGIVDYAYDGVDSGNIGPFAASFTGSGGSLSFGLNASSVLTGFDFGTVMTGASGSLDLYAHNSSLCTNGPLGPASVSGNFSITGDTCNSTTLAANSGNHCNISVVFTPSSSGTITDSLSISGPYGSYALPLSGYGSAVPPASLCWSGASSHDFGDVASFGSGGGTLYPANCGGTGTNSLTTAVSGAEFSFASGTCSGSPLGSGTNCALTIQYSPVSTGSFTGSVSVTDGTTSLSGDLSGTSSTFSINFPSLKRKAAWIEKAWNAIERQAPFLRTLRMEMLANEKSKINERLKKR